MRIFRVSASVGIVAIMLVALAVDASAKASAAVCDKVMLTEADMGQLGGKKFHASSFQKAAKAFTAGANAAPGKVKSAMKTMARYYQKIGSADSQTDAITSLTPTESERFAKASVTWGLFVAKNCA